MLAQRKNIHLDKMGLISSHNLPEPASDLLEKIITYQSILSKLISFTLTLPDKKVSNSFKMFLNESKDKLRFFIMTCDEITAQISVFNTNVNFFKPPTFTLPAKTSEFVALTEIRNTTNILFELYTQLQKNLEQSPSQVFFKDLIQKSLIFYKQTHVVLNGYLRTFKVKSD